MPRTINIVHLSDLHFDQQSSYDISVVLDALTHDLSQLDGKSLSPDFVVFSGDLVRAADDADTYLYFYDNVLDRIALATGCAESRLIFTPGNHDVHRSAVKKHKGTLTDLSLHGKVRDKLNAAFRSDILDGIIADKFSGYRDIVSYLTLHPGTERSLLYDVYHYDESDVGIVAANTAWMSWAGLEKKSDLRELLYPEEAIAGAVNAVRRHKVRILVTHHPLNWLTEDSERDFLATCGDTFQVHLFGHMHEPRPTSVASLYGKCLQNQSGALYSGRNRYIGYSIIEYDIETANVAVHLRAYSDTRREFHPAEQLVSGGIAYPSDSARVFWRARSRAVDHLALTTWVTTALLPKSERELNEGLADRKLCDVFVAPPLVTQVTYSDPLAEGDDAQERKEVGLSFEQLCKSGNYVIHGRAEYGKTTLLKQAALHLLQNQRELPRPMVPIIISFGDIAKGRDRILRALRAGIAEEPTSWTLVQLLDDGLVCVLLDDVILTDTARMSIVREFVARFPRNRYVLAAMSGESDRFSAVIDPELAVATQPVIMKPMTRRGMRSLLTKWDSTGRFNQEDMLNRLLNEITSINVPLTAVNGTIFLTIYETQAHFRAINRAVLIENFIEVLLDKGSPLSIERRTFDFTNQKHLLSHVAAWMARSNQYVVEARAMREVVQQYLDNVGLPNNPDIIIGDFMLARIFSSRSDDRISFRYRAFLEYFLANQMRTDEVFKTWVLDDGRYLSYTNEILYYAGMDRADDALLELICERFADLRATALIDLRWNIDANSLSSFALPSEKASADAILSEFERHVGAPPMSEEERDEVLEAELPRDGESRQEVFRPRTDDIGQRLFLGLLLYSGLVRNLELIPDQTKRRHLSKVLDAWAMFLMGSLQLVPLLARHRRMKVNGVLYDVLVPRHFTEAQVARTIYVGMPASLARPIAHHLGTEKLERQLTQPSLDEGREAGIVTFFRACLCADLKLGDWWNGFAAFAERFRASPYLLHVMLWKMRDLHVMGSVPDCGVPVFRRALVDAIATLRGGGHKNRLRVRSQELQRLSRQDMVRRIKASFSD